ncbi:hypothetical protein ABIF14_002439 [Bradyrhizobium elkanii]
MLEILVAARHGVAAERALVPGDAGGHTQPRIGVDIGGADETLGELVDDVIVLGQELAGDIERDRIGPVLPDDPVKAIGDAIKRVVPRRRRAVHHRLEQTPVEIDGLGKRRALAAKPTEIGRVLLVALDGDGTRRVLRRDDATADTAIRTRGLDGHCLT